MAEQFDRPAVERDFTEGFSAESVRGQLDTILQSATFSTAPILKGLLRYLVERKIQGTAAEIKEYSIGVEVLNRGASFDPKTDSIVRTHARRLRLKLLEYYESEGHRDPILIEVPKGHYVPVVRSLPTLGAGPVRRNGEIHAASQAVEDSRPGFWTVWRFRFVAGLILVLSITGTLAFARWRGQRHRQAELETTYRAALHLLRQRDLPSMVTAADQFRGLVQLHPQFAPGWAGLAEASALIHPEDASASLEIADRSVRIDPRCGECHAILGFILFARHWKWAEAAEHLTRAVALSPNDPQIRYWLAQMEASRGRVTQALRSIDESRKRMPHAMNLLVMKAGCLYFARDYQAALHTSDQALALNLPAAWYWRASALFQLGKHVEALRSVAYELGSGSSRSAEATALRADALVARFDAAGLKGALGGLLRETSSPDIAEIQSLNRATWFMLLGEYDPALHELEIAVNSHPRPFNLIYVNVDPVFDPIRTQPKFQNLLRKLGMP